MASARNYWSTDDLWKDFHYWRWRAEQARQRPGWGDQHQAINIAELRSAASFNVLAKRRPELRAASFNAIRAIEGRAPFARPEVPR